jgi:hypothetical protein
VQLLPHAWLRHTRLRGEAERGKQLGVAQVLPLLLGRHVVLHGVGHVGAQALLLLQLLQVLDRADAWWESSKTGHARRLRHMRGQAHTSQSQI